MAKARLALKETSATTNTILIIFFIMYNLYYKRKREQTLTLLPISPPSLLKHFLIIRIT